jgi:hypothetical protein
MLAVAETHTEAMAAFTENVHFAIFHAGSFQRIEKHQRVLDRHNFVVRSVDNKCCRRVRIDLHFIRKLLNHRIVRIWPIKRSFEPLCVYVSEMKTQESSIIKIGLHDALINSSSDQAFASVCR